MSSSKSRAAWLALGVVGGAVLAQTVNPSTSAGSVVHRPGVENATSSTAATMNGEVTVDRVPIGPDNEYAKGDLPNHPVIPIEGDDGN